MKDMVTCKIESFAVLVNERIAHVSPTYKPDIGLLVVAIPTEYLFNVMHCDQEDAEGMMRATEELDDCMRGIIDGVGWMNGQEEKKDE